MTTRTRRSTTSATPRRASARTRRWPRPVGSGTCIRCARPAPETANSAVEQGGGLEYNTASVWRRGCLDGPEAHLHSGTNGGRHMAKSMTKSAIIGHLAQKTNLSKKQVADVMDQLLVLATKEAKNVFVLPNFGRLVLANRKARMGRNPQTGEPIKIPAKRVVKFRLAKSLKDAVLGKK